MRPPKLTEYQKKHLKLLETRLKIAISERDYKSSKDLLSDLDNLLSPTGHYTRLAQSKNRFYELALEEDELRTAIRGFQNVRVSISKNTRLYLEATTLLSLCHLRRKDLERAKPLIQEVLTNDKVIKSEETRTKFRAEVVERYSQEATLFSLRNKGEEKLTEEEVEKEVIRLLTTNNESDIYIGIGKIIPSSSKNLLFQVHEYSTKQLPSAEKLALPNPEQKIKDESVGKTFFQSVKRVIYNSICDPKNEIYKTWFTNGMSAVLQKGYIRATVIACLSGLGIGFKLLAASVIALIIRFGLDVYCEKYKPTDLMELRGK